MKTRNRGASPVLATVVMLAAPQATSDEIAMAMLGHVAEARHGLDEAGHLASLNAIDGSAVARAADRLAAAIESAVSFVGEAGR